jgi:galactose mutarotase-like enzyme
VSGRGYLRPAGRCRTWHGGVLGHDAVVVENRWLRATVLPQRGALLHELVHKPSDTDLLWRWERGLRPAQAGPANRHLAQGGFQDAFAGGWDLMLPAVSRLVAAPEVGSHGETWALPWDVVVERDDPDEVRVRFETRCLRTPFDVRRTLTLGTDARLRCRTDVRNRGSRPHPFAMGEHAVWDVAAALSDGARIRVDDPGTLRAAPEQPDGSLLVAGAQGTWPTLPLVGGGARDLSSVGPDDRGSTGLAAVRVPAGRVRLEAATRPAVDLSWDADVLPWLLLWLPLGGDHGAPWFGTVEALGLEPVTVPPWTSPDALPLLAPGDVVTSTWSVTVDDEHVSA